MSEQAQKRFIHQEVLACCVCPFAREIDAQSPSRGKIYYCTNGLGFEIEKQHWTQNTGLWPEKCPLPVAERESSWHEREVPPVVIDDAKAAFRVGDKVRITGNMLHNENVGEDGVIIKFDLGNYKVSVKNDTDWRYVAPQDLTLIERAQQ